MKKAATKTKRTYHQITTDSAPLAEYLESHPKTNYSALGRELGLSSSTIGGWINKGKMPSYMTHVVKSLGSKNGDGEPQPRHSTYIIHGHPDKIDTIVACAIHLGVETLNINIVE